MKLFLLLFLTGCVTQMTEVEREQRLWKLQIDRENWSLCQLAYKSQNVPMLHRDHTHIGGKTVGVTEKTALRSDLQTNQCRRILGDYWATY